MSPSHTGSFRLFRVAGISVYLHWSWLLLAYIEIVSRPSDKGFNYTTPAWAVIEYLTLFAIVLLHEFGHALACRSVGGIADHIVLWPLGGIAYVAPPPRPAPTLWSIAAGPLVNVLLVPVTLLALFVTAAFREQSPDIHTYVTFVCLANLGLLIFNLLPIYPLDGGQILQSILWFFLGRGRSLLIVSGIGVLGAVALIALAIRGYRGGSEWVLLLIAAFICFRSIIGFQQARLMLDRMHLPRHPHAACPSCGEAPLEGDYWRCDQCGNLFDTFVHQAVCPHCDKRFEETACPDCHWRHPMAEWRKAAEQTTTFNPPGNAGP